MPAVRHSATLSALAETFGGSPSAGPRAAAFLETNVSEPGRSGLVRLVTLLGRIGFARWPLRLRDAALAALGMNPEVAIGIDGLRTIVLLATYGDPASWPALGMPEPPEQRIVAEPLPTGPPPKRVDAVVVGSGAGGSVIAAELAQAGLTVAVLEAGPQVTRFTHHELDGFGALYWRGHYQRNVDNLVGMAAGATLGGGTTINWSNCYPPPGVVRAEWAAAGLDDVATPAFDVHLAAIAERFGITSDASDDHGSNAVLRRGAERLGLDTRRAARNADVTRYDPASAGYMGLGDRSGSKLATTANYLRDAVAAGATLTTGCRVLRITTQNGKATGVTAILGGQSISIAAAVVVVAAGSIETPALLLRSRIGGPAVGHHLHLHPVVGMLGLYPDKVEPWRGAPQTTQVTQYLEREAGHGFLIECPAYHPGLFASVTPGDRREHRRVVERAAFSAPIIARIRDRGAGRVSIDDNGEALVHYTMHDALDRRHVAHALQALARVHEAAGAEEIIGLGARTPPWRRGDALERFIANAVALPIRAGGRNFMSAHQMGSARMGRDPATSVADVRGELHDIAGVWIGDASAFPTASGANPMWSIMALARRTAQAIAVRRSR